MARLVLLAATAAAVASLGVTEPPLSNRPMAVPATAEGAGPPPAAHPGADAIEPLARFGDARLRHPAPVRSLALTRDGKTLATTTPTEPVIRFWDVATGRLLRELRVDQEFTASLTLVGFAPDARRLVVIRHQWRQRASASHKWSEPSTVDTMTGAITHWGWGREG